jgi:sugar lactone lactonase YvrE
VLIVAGCRGATPVASESTAAAPPSVTAPERGGRPSPESPLKVERLLVFGDEGFAPGTFRDARTIAVAPDGSIFVADYETQRLQKFDASGAYVMQLVVPPNARDGDRRVLGMAADRAGSLYVCRAGDLLKFRVADGELVQVISGSYPDTWYAGGISIDSSGRLYAITEKLGPRDESTNVSDLIVLSPSGEIVARHENVGATTVATDDGSHVYLPRRYKDRIDVLDAGGKVLAQLNSRPRQQAEIRRMRAIALDGRGHLFIQNSSDVSVLDLSGRYVTTLELPALRSFAFDVHGNLFALIDGIQVAKYEIALRDR